MIKHNLGSVRSQLVYTNTHIIHSLFLMTMMYDDDGANKRNNTQYITRKTDMRPCCRVLS